MALRHSYREELNTNHNANKVHIPDHNDTDLFSDSSDDEADVRKMSACNREEDYGQSSSPGQSPSPLTHDTQFSASSTAATSPSSFTDNSESSATTLNKHLRRERTMRDAMERIKRVDLVNTKLSPTNGSRQPRRKRSKIVIRKGNKRKVRLRARKSLSKNNNRAASVVYDEQRCVMEDGDLEFIKIFKMEVNKKRGRSDNSNFVHVLPNPACPTRLPIPSHLKEDEKIKTRRRSDELSFDAKKYLNRLGWQKSRRSKQSTYMLSQNGLKMKVSNEKMIKVVNSLSFDGAFDEFTAGRVEEELLLGPIQFHIERQGQVAAAIHDSEFPREQPDGQSAADIQDTNKLKKSTNEKKQSRVKPRKPRPQDDNNGMHFDGAAEVDDGESIAPPESLSRANETSKESTIGASINSDALSLKYIRVEKSFPKFTPDNNEIPLFGQPKVDSIREKVLKQFGKPPDKSLIMKVSDLEEDRLSLKLHITGRRDIVEIALSKLVNFVSRKIAKWNSKKLLEGRETIEIDIRLAIDSLDLTQMCLKGHESLWIYDFLENSQFRDIFGPKAHRGVAIIKIGVDPKNLEDVSSISQLNEILETAKKKKEKWVVARICVDALEDLSTMNIKMIEKRGGSLLPHYRNKPTSYNGPYKNMFQSHAPGRRLSNPKIRKSAEIQMPSSSTVIPRKRKTNGISGMDYSKQKAPKRPSISGVQSNQISSEMQLTNCFDSPPIRRLSATERMQSKNSSISGTQSNQLSSKMKRKLGETMSEASNTKEQQPNAPTVDAQETPYSHFTDKVRSVREIEFSALKSAQTVYGIMWAVHKKRFGTSCDDRCQCMLNLSCLTENIVSKYERKRQKNDPSFKVHDEAHKSCGFINSFCPKFIQYVQSSFPNDSPKQNVEKLVDMWENVHRKNMRFGLNCSKSCPCLDSWRVKFLPHLKGEKKQKSDNKKSPLSMGTINNTSTTTRIESWRNLLNKAEGKKATAQSSREEVLFRPTKYPLGFYCKTERSGESDTRCIVTSVCPDCSKKISVGSIIEKYQINNNPEKKIESHKELKGIFDALKAQGGNPKLVLKVVKSQEARKSKEDCRNDWNKSANSWVWVGYDNSGWAGGSMLHGKQNTNGSTPQSNTSQIALGLPKKHLSEFAKEKIKAAQQKPVSQASTNKIQITRKNQNTVVQGLSNNAQPMTQRGWNTAPAQFAPKILKKGRKQCTGNKVTIDEGKNEHFTWDAPEPSALETRVLQETAQNKVSTAYKAVSTCRQDVEEIDSEKLEQLLLSKSITTKDLIRRLKFSNYDLSALKEPIKKIKQLLSELDQNFKSEAESNSNDRESILVDRKFFNLRSKVIKIFELAHKIIGGERRTRIGIPIDGAARFFTQGQDGVHKFETLENFIEEVKKEKRFQSEQLPMLCDWIVRFQGERDDKGKRLQLGIDCNIADQSGVSLIHAAIVIGDEQFVKYFVKERNLQHLHTVENVVVQTPLDFAKSLKIEASMEQNAEWAGKYERIIKTLESSSIQNSMEEKKGN